MTPRISEKALQQQIIDYIALAAPYVLVFEFGKPGGRWSKCRKCGGRVRTVCEVCGQSHGGMAGNVPVGWPDLVLLNRGTLPPEVLFVEIKVPGGKLSEGQERMRRELLDAGARHYVCYSVEQMADILRQHGVSLRCQP